MDDEVGWPVMRKLLNMEDGNKTKLTVDKKREVKGNSIGRLEAVKMKKDTLALLISK